MRHLKRDTHQVHIQIDEPFDCHIAEDWLRNLTQHTLAVAGVKSLAEVSLVITDDEIMRQLNQQYRGIEHTTDVLSFALREESDNLPFALPPDGILHLGEVIISYPQVVRQAQEYPHSLQQEIALLVVHGILHLLGYDHEQPEAEREMKALEKKILQQYYLNAEQKEILVQEEG